MIFRIGDFIVRTEKKIEELKEEIIYPKVVKNGKPSDYDKKNKTRELMVFKDLDLIDAEDDLNYIVIKNLFDFIDLIELFKAFTSNKLDTSKEYQISDSFTAAIAQKDGNISLKIHFEGFNYSLFLDKFECSSLAAKFGKILQKCEAWQEPEA